MTIIITTTEGKQFIYTGVTKFGYNGGESFAVDHKNGSARIPINSVLEIKVN